MHELGIVFHIIDSLKDIAQDNNVKKIQSVTVEIGEVSAVIAEYLTDCWVWARKKHPFIEECEMKTQTIHAVTHCGDCEKNYDTVSHAKVCPHCGSENTWLLTGNEISIKEIAVYDEDG